MGLQQLPGPPSLRAKVLKTKPEAEEERKCEHKYHFLVRVRFPFPVFSHKHMHLHLKQPYMPEAKTFLRKERSKMQHPLTLVPIAL